MIALDVGSGGIVHAGFVPSHYGSPFRTEFMGKRVAT
jgi:hypothetical protein